ncbi:MAG TPA: endo-1,3-alpha-glucanase family glycosylhydrolase [Armatimonadota bacterium]
MRTTLRFLPIASVLVLLTLIFAMLPAHTAPFPDSKGQRLVMAHYMPCFPVIRPWNTAATGYGYQYESDPKNDPVKAARSSRPILYATTIGNVADVELQATVTEIRLAKEAGIDGFFVDLLWDQPKYLAHWQRLLKAAEIAGNFYIGLMPDYATLKGPSEKPVKEGGDTSRQMILHWLQVASASPALLRYDGKAVVATYDDRYPDGKGAAEVDKTLLVQWLAEQGMPVAFMATQGSDWDQFYTQAYGKEFATFAFGAGTFSPISTLANRDRVLAYWPESMLIMGEVSPMYYNRGWMYSATRGTALFREAWMWNIQHRDRVQWIQSITWNDFGETPLAPDNNHFMAWLPLMRYYSDWFKTGKQPVLKTDFLSLWHRPHPYAAEPTVYKYKVKSNTPTDEIEALAILNTPATLVIKTGEKVFRQEVGSGVQSVNVPFQLGEQSVWLERNGKVVCTVTTPVPIHDKPNRENLWFIAADSTHSPRPLPTTDWTVVRGTWQVTPEIRTGSGLTLTGDASTWGNYTVSATLQPQFTLDEQSVGLVGRAGGTAHYQFTFNRQGQWQIARSDAGKVSVIERGAFTYHPGQAVQLALRCVGEHIIGYLDGALVSANGYDYALTYGKAGILADDTPTAVRDFHVLSYDPDLWHLP